MISSFSLLDDSVVRSIQKDYITAADNYRLVKSVEVPSRWDKLLTKLHMPNTSVRRQSRSHSTHTLARV